MRDRARAVGIFWVIVLMGGAPARSLERAERVVDRVADRVADRVVDRAATRGPVAPAAAQPEAPPATRPASTVEGGAPAAASTAGACRTRSRGCVPQPPAAEPIDLRDYIQQGFFGGQLESDPVHWHGEGFMHILRCPPDACDEPCLSLGEGDVDLLGGFFHKQYGLDRSGEWLCENGAAPSVHNMKSPRGAPIEFACTDAEEIVLMWETSPFIACEFNPLGNPRLFLREEDGEMRDGALWTPVHAVPGELVPHRIHETRFECGAAGEITESSRGSSVSFVQILGPYDISTPEARSRTLGEWRRRFIVPPRVSDEEALPAAWFEGFPGDIGREGAPVEIVIRRDYLNILGDDFTTRDRVEHYFYGVIDRGSEGQFGTGLIRWSFASLRNRRFHRQSTVTRLVAEPAGAPLLGRDLCER